MGQPSRARAELSLPSFPHSRLQAAAMEPPGAGRSAGGERPVSALCWQDWGSHTHIWRTLPLSRAPHLNPLGLHNRYPVESCPSPSTFWLGFLQLSKYFSYLFECIHVELHTIKEAQTIKQEGRQHSVGTLLLISLRR